MMDIYVTCGVWELGATSSRIFSVDEEKGGRLLVVESGSTLEELNIMVLEDFGIKESIASLELSYLPIELSIHLHCDSKDQPAYQMNLILTCGAIRPANSSSQRFKGAVTPRFNILVVNASRHPIVVCGSTTLN
ncbi:hypothetical protein F2Q68_00026557 [Brassica cretica]|uniref:Uncharacterized protein n=1 Tax=Brassica cretica TaxID=69181 RepID=A0A8S9I9N1_BRACR|nr:hypothetical protein F2Q68_00026557 [Brassica cretica]